MQEERKHKKADIETELGIRRPTLTDTMKDCGVDTSNPLHTDSEVEKIKKARQIMDATKSRDKVREYFSTQDEMKDAKPNPTEQDLWSNGQSTPPVDADNVSDSTILDFFRQYQSQMGALLAAAAPSMAADLHDAFNLMVMASIKKEYQDGNLAKTINLYTTYLEQGGNLRELLAAKQGLQIDQGHDNASGTEEDATTPDWPTSQGPVDETPDESTTTELQ